MQLLQAIKEGQDRLSLLIFSYASSMVKNKKDAIQNRISDFDSPTHVQ